MISVEYLRKQLDVKDLDFEFFTEVKAKLQKLAESERMRNLEKSINEERKEIFNRAGDHGEATNPYKDQIKIDKKMGITVQKLEAGTQSYFFQRKESMPSLNQNVGHQSIPNRNNQMGRSIINGLDFKDNKKSMLAVSTPQKKNIKDFQIKDASSNASRSGLTKSSNKLKNRTPEISHIPNKPVLVDSNNKYLKKMPFTWVRPGDTFTLTSTKKSNAYIQYESSDNQTGLNLPPKPLDKFFSKPNGSTYSSFYSGRPGLERNGNLRNQLSSTNGDLDDSFLQTVQPYTLEFQRDFYKMDRYQKLPPPNKNPEVKLQPKSSEMDNIKAKISKIKDYVKLHSQGFKNLESEDFKKHLERFYKPFFHSVNKSKTPGSNNHLEYFYFMQINSE